MRHWRAQTFLKGQSLLVPAGGGYPEEQSDFPLFSRAGNLDFLIKYFYF